MENQIFQLQYAIDTFYFLICGALVMWMAAGFSMLEAGLVRSKNTTEILTKNVALFAISCIMYMVCGYMIMYDGGLFLDGIAGGSTLVNDALSASAENGFDGGSVYAGAADFFFQVVFVATAMSVVSGAVAERMKLWAFLAFAVVMTGFIYPLEGSWTWNGDAVFGLYNLGELGFSDFAGSGIVHMAGASAALAGVPGLAVAPDDDYSVWNVLSLVLCVVVLLVTGIMVLDLVRNMWSWNEPHGISSMLMDWIVQ